MAFGKPISFVAFHKEYANEASCRKHLFHKRWPKGFVCAVLRIRGMPVITWKYVEMDETFYGAPGKSGKHGRGTGKASILVALSTMYISSF